MDRTDAAPGRRKTGIRSASKAPKAPKTHGEPDPYHYGSRKKGMPVWAWVILIIVVLYITMQLCAVSAPLAFMLFMGMQVMDGMEDTQTFSTDLLVADGGHYKHTLGEYRCNGLTIELNVSSDDERKFDLYIMNRDEYANAYGRDNTSIMSFSTLYSGENVSNIREKIELPQDCRACYLIIDNRDTPLTPGDAVPDGSINVSLNIKIINEVKFGN